MTNAGTCGFFRQGTNIAWLVLVVSTLFGWWLGYVVNSADGYVRVAASGVLVTAFVKTWVVGFQFMELRHAPWWLRHAFNAWVLVMGGALLLLRV